MERNPSGDTNRVFEKMSNMKCNCYDGLDCPKCNPDKYGELDPNVAKAAGATIFDTPRIKPFTLSKRPYYYECGDGCCQEWGEKWFVNGEQVCSGPCDDDRLQQLLEHFGIDARIVIESEEVCEL